MKKAIAALLALLLWVSCFGFTAQAAEVTNPTEPTERVFENMSQRVPNPEIPNPKEIYLDRYIPMYKGLDTKLHVYCQAYYTFPPIFDTGDILPINVNNSTEMLQKAGIVSCDKIECAAELISVDKTVPYHMVIVHVKDQAYTKAIAKEMVENINLEQWEDIKKLNAGVFGIRGYITMVVLDETLFDAFYPTFVKWCNIDVETYVDYVEYKTLNTYQSNEDTYFTWKLSDESPEAQ